MTAKVPAMSIDLDAYAIACAAIDEAAFDATKWSVAVDHLAVATGSRASELIGVDARSAVPVHMISDINLDPAALRRDWHAVGGATPAINPMIRAGLASPPMRLLLDHELISKDSRQRHILWNEVFDPFDIPHLGSVIIDKNATEHIVVSLLRGKHQGPVEGEARRLMEDFAWRVKSSIAISRSLGSETTTLLTDALAAANAAAVVLSGWRKVIGITESAEAILSNSQNLSVSNGHLRAADPATIRRLNTAISAAERGRSAELTIPFALGSKLKICVHPLSKSVQLGFHANVMMTLQTQHDVDHLTSAEQAVLKHLAEGRTLEEIARLREVSKETIRTQSKLIYSKLGVTRQMDLVRLFGGDRWGLANTM